MGLMSGRAALRGRIFLGLVELSLKKMQDIFRIAGRVWLDL